MKRVIIFGGQGFIGSEIVNQLTGYKVYTCGRGKSKENHISANILDKSSIQHVIQKHDIVINLVGLTPTRIPQGATYQDIHVQGVKNILDVCKHKQCRLIHMSALGAHKQAQTEYLRTKAQGEHLVLNSGLDITVFCPSIIFDTQNELIQLINSFSWTRFFPNIPAQVQPVYRKDIARLFVLAVQGKIKEQKIEVGGRETVTIFRMAQLFFQARNRYCIAIPFWCVKLGLTCASMFHLKGIGKDQITSLTLDNITPKKQEYVTLTRYSSWVKRVSKRMR